MSQLNRAATIAVAATLAVPLAVAAPNVGAGSPAQASTTVAPVAGAPAPSARASRAQARVALGRRAVTVASHYQGVPYRYGGTTPRGFDCSGFTRFVFAQLHERLPRTAQEQFDAAHRVQHPRVGDLLFYHSGSRRGHVYHVGIYAGHGKVWHAPRPGERVGKTRIYSGFWTAGRF